VKILIYGLNYRPEPIGVGKYTAEMAEALVERGHQVQVITAPPHYPQWRLAPGYAYWHYRREQYAGVNILRSPLILPRRMTPLRRVLACALFALLSFPALLGGTLRRRPQVLIVIEPSLFCLPGALLVGALLRIPVWLHVQDFELGAAAGLGYFSESLGTWATRVEGWLMRRAARVSTISETMEQRLQILGVVPERRFLLRNGVDCRSIFPLPHASPMRAQLGITADEIVLLYSGSLGRKQGLELIINAARRLQSQPRLRFIICGDGPELSALQATAGGLANIVWLPLQPRERLNDLLNLADIHLLPQRPGVTESVLPSKLTGMFASARPLLAAVAADSELARVAAIGGIVVSPNDESAFDAAALDLSTNRELRFSLGKRGRRHAQESFDQTALMKLVDTILAQLAAEK
jgi:colanic acid biosynthesis glycosyl transferase WcaI